MLLSRLLEGLENVEVIGNANSEISSIAYDSRKVVKGSLFVCIEGFKQDGHEFINDAIEKGAVAVVVSKDVTVDPAVVIIKTNNTRKLLAQIASRFFDHPSKKLRVIGVTGTKGKTTTTFMIKSILEKNGFKVGLVGTIANYIGSKQIAADRTTPESLNLQEMFADMIKQGIDTVVMEVSSHSLDLQRVEAIYFDIAVFTNLSQDHLDYHKNFENYFEAKAKLFKQCKHAIINIDDTYGKRLVNKTSVPTTTFGIENEADLKADDIKIKPSGTQFYLSSKKNSTTINVPIPGIFSVYNALAAIAVCQFYDAKDSDILQGLKDLQVPGRAEIAVTNPKFTVMVDYAHSPDSLDNILKAVRVYAKGRIVCIFGCGGDRDRTKRPIMGEIAGNMADFTIITSDNPRTEDPASILSEIEEGIKRTKSEYKVILDRRQAIEFAINNAQQDDMIIIAGKGHETYQIFKSETIHFDDREVAKEIYNAANNR
jgi:UDP-N-acetylmuramoyl-L-alanyl-D-glutamate--2,6-diaminopimelate ligase